MSPFSQEITPEILQERRVAVKKGEKLPWLFITSDKPSHVDPRSHIINISEEQKISSKDLPIDPALAVAHELGHIKAGHTSPDRPSYGNLRAELAADLFALSKYGITPSSEELFASRLDATAQNLGSYAKALREARTALLQLKRKNAITAEDFNFLRDYLKQWEED